MRNNTLTIIKKEFARFFNDRALVITTIIMPGLLIYLVYSLIGNGMAKFMNEGADDVVTLQVENMPSSFAPMFNGLDTLGVVLVNKQICEDDINTIADKNVDVVLMRFPQDFDNQMFIYNPQSGNLAPNVEIFYNSTNEASNRVYTMVEGMLTSYENAISNRFDINRTDSDMVYNMASDDQMLGDILSKMIPMLIVMLLFSGAMAIAPTSIAGEKERGTIATLLVTPMKRSELAIGKIISLSCIALLSGISSFIGIILSLPKMIMMNQVDMDFSGIYTTNDYIILLLVILATVLIIISVISILSAWAKDVKNAGTMITPFMLVVMAAGLIPMFQTSTTTNLFMYFIPFYNSTEVMASIFAHEMELGPVIITLGSNLVYTLAAIWGLTKMFNSERVMFSR